VEYVLIGKLVNTHALKGEVRIISDFKYKSRVFVPKAKLYIGRDREEVTIETYRTHKTYDMCKFIEYNYINDVLKFKGQKVYVKRDILKLSDNEYLDDDLIGLNAVYNSSSFGSVRRILNNNGYKVLLVNDKYIPYNDNFIEIVDLNNKKIVFKNLEGLI